MKLLAAAAILACCATAAGAETCTKDGPAEIKAVYDHWLAAYRAHDLDGTMAIFSYDVVFQFQGAPDARWADLKTSYAQEFASHPSGVWSPQFGSIEVSGDLAAAPSEWRLVEAGAVKAHNNSIDLFRRDAKCRWHIVRSLNYPLKDK
jgi:ketosteroid isomerase-like protein